MANSLQDYCNMAREKLGAVSCRVDYYPVKHGKGRQVFAYRFFDVDNNEVCYHLPEVGALHIFDTPRVWPFHAVALLPEVQSLRGAS